MIFRNTSDDANRQAADWVARLHADDRSIADEAGFSKWIVADPAHALAFERASAIWDALGGISARPAAKPAAISRRMVLVGSAVIAVTGAATIGLDRAGAVEYATSVGEQRRITLNDGTRVMLDTATRIRYSDEREMRQLSLIAGQINVDISSDPRPFVIDGGAGRAVSRAARIDMRRDGEALALTAIAGSVRLSGNGADRIVATGERVAIARDTSVSVDRPELRDLTAWQNGRLAFRDETLASAVAEMNRYSHRRLVIVDPAAGQLRLSGVYRVGDPEAFARSLAVLLSVRVDPAPESVKISLPG